MRFFRPAVDRSFVGHYIEMVFAMYAGMFILGMPLADLASVGGVDTAHLDETAPAFVLLDMAVVMTVPMVAWMRFRHQHGWQACLEMAVSMLIPTVIAICLIAFDVVQDFGALMTFEHLAMFPAMLIAMLVRPLEYSGGPGHAAAATMTSATA
jgi:hypothetical protein